MTAKARPYRQAVQAGRARRKGLIDEVACRKIIGVIHPAIPFDTGGLCGLAVCRAHPAALPAPELLGGQVGNILIRETELVHFAHHFQMLPLVGKALSLPFQQAGVLTQGTAMGVEPHAVLPHPDRCHTGIPHQLHGTVGHTGAWPQQQDRDARRRDLNDPLFIRYGNCSIVPAKSAMFQIQKGHPVPELRQRLPLGPHNARHLSHGLLPCG